LILLIVFLRNLTQYMAPYMCVWMDLWMSWSLLFCWQLFRTSCGGFQHLFAVFMLTKFIIITHARWLEYYSIIIIGEISFGILIWLVWPSHHITHNHISDHDSIHVQETDSPQHCEPLNNVKLNPWDYILMILIH